MRQEYLVSWFLTDEDLRVLARGELTAQNDGTGAFHAVSVTQQVPVLAEGTASLMVYLFRDGPLRRHVGCFANYPPVVVKEGDEASLVFTQSAFSIHVDTSALVDA